MVGEVPLPQNAATAQNLSRCSDSTFYVTVPFFFFSWAVGLHFTGVCGTEFTVFRPQSRLVAISEKWTPRPQTCLEFVRAQFWNWVATVIRWQCRGWDVWPWASKSKGSWSWACEVAQQTKTTAVQGCTSLTAQVQSLHPCKEKGENQLHKALLWPPHVCIAYTPLPLLPHVTHTIMMIN